MIRLLAKLSDAAFTELHDPLVARDFLYLDAQKEYFRHQMVDLSLPRSTAITETVSAGTVEYVLWVDGEGPVDTFDNFQDAIDAFQRSKFEYQPRRVAVAPRAEAEMTVEHAETSRAV
jgi:hypothetical protein